MTVQELNIRLEQVRSELKSTRESYALTLGKDILALQKSRIINLGVDDKGEKIGDYSEAVVPAWMYKNKEARVADPVKKLIKAKGWFASYKDWREVNNLQTIFKNFSFTGHMWSAVYPVILERDEHSITLGYNALDDNARKKLRYVIQKHENIFNLSVKEKEWVDKSVENRVKGALSKFGIGE